MLHDRLALRERHWTLATRTPMAAVLAAAILLSSLTPPSSVYAQAPARPAPPSLAGLFPAGAQAGTYVELSVGAATRLTLFHPDVRCEQLEGQRFRLSIPAEMKAGVYDLWAESDGGLSAPRRFVVGDLPEFVEVEPNDERTQAMPLEINRVIQGRAEKAGDRDWFKFTAQRGRCIVLEVYAERLDSKMRATLEVFDASGRRVVVDRGFHGVDPLVPFLPPADGDYFVCVQDLIAGGSAEHTYRLSIDTSPKAVAAHPCVVRRGESARVSLLGWNLSTASSGVAMNSGGVRAAWETVELELPKDWEGSSSSRAFPLSSPQIVAADDLRAAPLPGAVSPPQIAVVDAPVVVDKDGLRTADRATVLPVPCELAGRLVEADERDWFAVEARRGEVFYLEAFGQRMNSPVDLQLTIYDSSGRRELARFVDERRNLGGVVPTSHDDPTGRWVCPADGTFLLEVRQQAGGAQSDPRRVYRLSVRREEPDFAVLAVPNLGTGRPLVVPRGGRESLELHLFRQRGLTAAVRVFARNLPPGIRCSDAWFGPGVEHATLVVSADDDAVNPSGATLEFVAASSSDAIEHPVYLGMSVKNASLAPVGRLVSRLPLVVGESAPARLTAAVAQSLQHPLYGRLQLRHSPGGIVDVQVEFERRGGTFASPVKVTATGLPESITNASCVAPADAAGCRLSFALPPTLAPGRYSWAFRAETSLAAAGGSTTPLVMWSEPIEIDVGPAAFQVVVDPFAPRRVRRGETIQVAYTATRLNGFIGKMHTELAIPGLVTDVPGVRGRGETFVGQTERGTLQIVVNDDAPLGPVSFLRLFTVGVVEDEPAYFGAAWLPLEIIE